MDEAPTPIDVRLIQWFAVQMVDDARARLVESGSDGDVHIMLGDVFVELRGTVCTGRRVENVGVVQALARGRLGDGSTAPTVRCVLIGGPGAGKSTLTAMAAQVLRLHWVEAHRDVLPAELRKQVEEVTPSIRAAAERLELTDVARALPVRLSLPVLAERGADAGARLSMWDHLAASVRESLRRAGIIVECSAEQARGMCGGAAPVAWYFDGLDEVPAGTERDEVAAVVRALLDERPGTEAVVITTRPQGYGGEFDHLDELMLSELDWFSAQSFCERLLGAWKVRNDHEALVTTLRHAFHRPEIQSLVRSPLHATIVAYFVARGDTLPDSRWVLFDRYFDILFQRELRKLKQIGIKEEDRDRVFELHARVGLALHVRGQFRARATLGVREFRSLLEAFFREEENDNERVEEHTSRMLRFASERLVLVLRVAEGGYGFAIRPLQEFFAAAALRTVNKELFRKRLDSIVRSPHWANVVPILASGLVVKAVDPPSRELALVLAEVCNALDEGSTPTARCCVGARLALALLRETERYGKAWMHRPLWEVALKAAKAPLQNAAAVWTRRSALGLGSFGASQQWNDEEDLHTRLGIAASRWQGDRSLKVYERLVEIAAARLGGDEGDRYAAWCLLNEALRTAEPKALELARCHLPQSRDEGREIIRNLRGLHGRNVNVDPVVMLVAARPEWYPPGWLWSCRGRSGWQRDGAQPAELAVAARLDEARPKDFDVLVMPTESWTLQVEVVPLAEQPKEVWTEIEVLMAGEGEVRLAWLTIARFHREPGHETLANVLDVLGEASFDDVRDVCSRFAWPLAACLAHVETVEALQALAAWVRSGAMGTVHDWQGAETSWRTNPQLEGADWSRWISATTPWEPRDPGPPIMGGFGFTSERHSTAVPEVAQYIAETFDAITRHGASARRALALLRSLIGDSTFVPSVTAGIPYEIASMFRDAEIREPGSELVAVNAMPELGGADTERWMELLHERGVRGLTLSLRRGTPRPPARLQRNLQCVAAYLTEHPTRWGLAQTLVAMLIDDPDAALDGLHLDVPPSDVSEHGAAQWTLLLLLSSPLPEDLGTAMQRLHGVFNGKPYDYRGTLGSILARRLRDPAWTERLLLAALDSATDADPHARDMLLGALLAHLYRTAPPAFADGRAWDELRLPQPHFDATVRTPMPFHLRAIDALSNFRIFRETPEVTASFPKAEPDRGQWIVLIGENGIGKTTFLRALALALATPEVATKQLHSRLPLVRNGGPAKLRFTFSSGTYGAEVHRAESGGSESVVGEAKERPWLVAYGVRRGNALGEDGRPVDWGAEGNLHTLFDRQPSLVVAQDWLLKLDRRVVRERSQAEAKLGQSTPAKDLWDGVTRALNGILEVDEIIAGDDDTVYVRRGTDRVRLESLSDGYLTTAGWIVDLIARWVRQREGEGDVLVGDILGQMTGVVLLDEIDLHLHPRWQLRVLDDVRRFFPKLTFIVTTHNPITLQGVKPGEVFVMRWGQSGRIELAQIDIHVGYDVDRVLLELFGVQHTFDAETRGHLREYRRLKLKTSPNAADDARRIEVEALLRQRLGTFGDTLVAQGSGSLPPLDEKGRANRDRFLERKRKQQ